MLNFANQLQSMLRSHTCGELRIQDVNMQVTLCGWIQRNRNLGSLIFIDLRDRFGITQLSFNEITNPDLYKQANKLGREFVIKVTGRVIERESKNPNLPTGDIEIYVEHLEILNSASIPPFTI